MSVRAVILDYNESVFVVLVVIGRVRCMPFLAVLLRCEMAVRTTFLSAATCICTGHVGARIRSLNY